MKQIIYKNIFMYSSLQFCGHTEEYFSAHTEKLVAYIIMPRLKNQYNLIRLYSKGKLTEEKKVTTSDNIFLYYLSWYFHYIYFLFKYFNRSESLIVLSGHPITFFFMSIQKLFRKITFAYWIGDYFPPVKTELVIFEKVKKYYHDRINLNYYLSDTINKIMNGRVVNNDNKRSVMWGVKSELLSGRSSSGRFNLLFIGLIKGGQGLEVIFRFLSKHKEYSTKIIGICHDNLFRQYSKMIRDLKIKEQVYFPNKFVLQADLKKIAEKCHVGVAIYDISPLSATYYTDPGKVKAYAEFGLPIIMSDTSAIAPFIRKYKSGETISSSEEALEGALTKLRKNYSSYTRGLKDFMAHFDYELYYRKSFVAFEKIANL